MFIIIVYIYTCIPLSTTVPNMQKVIIHIMIKSYYSIWRKIIHQNQLKYLKMRNYKIWISGKGRKLLEKKHKKVNMQYLSASKLF